MSGFLEGDVIDRQDIWATISQRKAWWYLDDMICDLTARNIEVRGLPTFLVLRAHFSKEKGLERWKTSIRYLQILIRNSVTFVAKTLCVINLRRILSFAFGYESLSHRYWIKKGQEIKYIVSFLSSILYQSLFYIVFQ